MGPCRTAHVNKHACIYPSVQSALCTMKHLKCAAWTVNARHMWSNALQAKPEYPHFLLHGWLNTTASLGSPYLILCLIPIIRFMFECDSSYIWTLHIITLITTTITFIQQHRLSVLHLSQGQKFGKNTRIHPHKDSLESSYMNPT